MVILVVRVLIISVGLVVALSVLLLVVGLFVLEFVFRSLHARSVIQLVVCFILVGLGLGGITELLVVQVHVLIL